MPLLKKKVKYAGNSVRTLILTGHLVRGNFLQSFFDKFFLIPTPRSLHHSPSTHIHTHKDVRESVFFIVSFWNFY